MRKLQCMEKDLSFSTQDVLNEVSNVQNVLKITHLIAKSYHLVKVWLRSSLNSEKFSHNLQLPHEST